MIQCRSVNNYTICINDDYLVTLFHKVGNDDVVVHEEPFTVFTNALNYSDKLYEKAENNEILEEYFDQN